MIEVDEKKAFLSIDQTLTRLDSWGAARRMEVPHEQAMGEARRAFAEEVRRICVHAFEERDLRVARAVQHEGCDGLRRLQMLGALLPIDLHVGERDALVRFVGALDATREVRAHELGEKLAREVSVHRGRLSSGRPPGDFIEYVDDGVRALLSTRDVARLREGWAVVVEPSTSVWGSESDLLLARQELGAHLSARGLASTSSCNSGAVTADLPLLGEGAGLSAPTLRLLRRLAAMPAVIEAHGWPRALRLPPLLQLASYSAESAAAYSPHYDRNEWERHNRREITILLYLNVGWDAARDGGCIRLSPPAAASAAASADASADAMQGALQGDVQGSTQDAGSQRIDVAPIDVSPLAGRLVLFHSALTRHEVLPCRRGERIAVTLWVEYAE